MNPTSLEDRYFENVPSRLNPRMVAPKPLRTSNTSLLDEKSSHLGFFTDPAVSDLSVLDDSLRLESSNNLLSSLLIDSKPRTPMDRIDVLIFPSIRPLFCINLTSCN